MIFGSHYIYMILYINSKKEQVVFKEEQFIKPILEPPTLKYFSRWQLAEYF